ncbi:hypothetical protein MSP8886_01342 [Marinomonas spartinae]|uniref:Tail tape measure protein n=1 Tax=Marinomonas spartinae TaxID=1792290 RepID=A0A1A8TBB3_9GAMM|nr:phage tail tape measure protein [Marinomonas spartinae]SBS28868.1 hypothetical protein MSP8886_01342 [Marinomonas spartinae]
MSDALSRCVDLDDATNYLSNDDQNGLAAVFGKVVNSEYANRAATRGHSLDMLGAKFDRMTIILGDRLLPVLDAVLPPLMSVVDSVADFAEANPQLATGLMGVAAAIAAVKAGAIAFKLAKLTLGNGRDRFNLGKTKLTNSTDQTTQSANRASRSLDRLNRKLNSLGAGARQSPTAYGGERLSKEERKRRKRDYLQGRSSGRKATSRRARPSRLSGRFRFGKYGRLAGLLSSGAALGMFSGSANASGLSNVADLAMTGADLAGAAGGISSLIPMGGIAGGVLKGAGKLFRPLDIALQGAGLASAISQGNSTQIGATAGDMAGGLGGAAAGGLAGAAIGSVVPVIGTAIGGIVGSIAGGMGGGSLGEWIGSKIGGWFADDKTDQPAPEAIAKQSQQLQNHNKSITFAPTIHLTPTGNPSYDQQISDQVIERLKAEFAQGMMGNMDVATRADGSLTDKRTS